MFLLYIALFVLAFLVLMKKVRFKDGKRFPGPASLPVLGNAHQFNSDNMHLKLSEWADEYGPLYEFSLLGQRIVMLNSEAVLRKTMSSDDFRSVFAGRQATFYGEYVLHRSESIAFTNDLDLALKMRKGFTKGVHVYGEGIKAFEEMVLREIGAVADRMKKYEGRDFDPTDLLKIGLGNILSILLSGHPINSTDVADDIFWVFQNQNDAILNTNLSFLSTSFPFLRFLPGIVRRLYLDLKKSTGEIFDRYVTEMKKTHVPGQIRGLVDFMIQSQEEDIKAGKEVVFTDERIHNTTTETIAAGLNTSVSALCSIVIYMINDQDRQERLHREIIQVFGKDRLPTLSERSKLPFLEAILHEALRYAPPIPLAIPHRCGDDVEFEGHPIRKGDMLILNLWHISHDKKIWGDPFVFRPERFLDKDGQLVAPSHPYRRNNLAFGIGRRQCVGEGLARSRIFLLVCVLIQRYRFLPPEKGECISTDPRKYQAGIALHPKPFKCRIESR